MEMIGIIIPFTRQLIITMVPFDVHNCSQFKFTCANQIGSKIVMNNFHQSDSLY